MCARSGGLISMPLTHTARITSTRVGKEPLDLFQFLDLESKRLRLELNYEDSLVGRVSIDSDANMQAALAAFVEENNLAFRTRFIEECIVPAVEVQCSKIQALPQNK